MQGTLESLPEVDACIASHLEHWDLSRLRRNLDSLRRDVRPADRLRDVVFLLDAIGPRVEGAASMTEAALEVNRWCGERVTFKPTGRRDQGVFETLAAGYGRCEELVILHVSALRSVCVPAREAWTRQVRPASERVVPGAAGEPDPAARWGRYWLYPLLAGGGLLIAGALVMGLLNVAAIQRRLSLDFSDLFRKGLGFDAVTGHFSLETGTVRMRVEGTELSVKGIYDAGRFDQTGDLDGESLAPYDVESIVGRPQEEGTGDDEMPEMMKRLTGGDIMITCPPCTRRWGRAAAAR